MTTDLNCDIPNAAIGILMPFFISFRQRETDKGHISELEESVLNVVPLVCNPNYSYETIHPVFHRRSQLPSYKWSAKQHQVIGYGVMINFLDNIPEVRDGNQKYPVCDLMNLDRLHGKFSSLNSDDLTSLQHIVLKASRLALNEELHSDILGTSEVCSRQRERNAKSLASIQEYESHISMISTLNIISQVLTKSRLKHFADALFEEIDQQIETSSINKNLYPWQLCSPDGPLKNNDYVRTLILIQNLTKIRLHIKHFSDHCHYTAQVLEAMGCLQNAGCSKSNNRDAYQINVQYLKGYNALQQKLLDTTYINIHENGAENLIRDDSLLHAKSLPDIVANINPTIYYDEYTRCIKDCANGLTNDIHIQVRSQLPFPAGELGNMAEKVLTNEALHACIGTQYLVGHQMLQMILYYLYDVIQDGSIFPSIQVLVSSYGEQRKEEESSGTICAESEKVVEHIFNMSKEYSTPSADSMLGRLLEAYSVSSGSNQFQQWSSEYCSQDSNSNKSYVFDSHEKLLSVDIPLPMNLFLSGNFIWSESTFKSLTSSLRSSRASQWERQNTAQLVFLTRYCYTKIHQQNVLSILEKITANGAFNDYLFTTVMNICYTAWLGTTLKWCEKQTSSTFGQLWNKYRFKRQLNPQEDVENQLPDIQCQDLKFGLHLIVGMKMVLLLPLWLTDLVNDDECKKKCAQIYDTCHISLSRSTKNVPYKSSITNWNFSQSEYESFDVNDCKRYDHLSFMVNILCAFYSCLTTLKTDDWRESRSEERECTPAYPKHPDCTTFSSLLPAFYKYIKIIMACPFDERGVIYEDEDQHPKNPLKFLILYFCDIALPLINELEDGDNTTMLMGRLNFRKIPMAVPDFDMGTTDDKAKKVKKKDGKKCGGRKNAPGSTFTIDAILEMIKDHFKCGYDNVASLPKIDGQEVVPLADVRNAIMLCCSNSTNNDGSISIVASKIPEDHNKDQGQKDVVSGKKGTRKVRINSMKDEKSSKKQKTQGHLNERTMIISRTPVDNKKSAKKMKQNEVISDEETYEVQGRSTQHPEKRGETKGKRAQGEEYVNTQRVSKSRLQDRFARTKGMDAGHEKLSNSTNKLGLLEIFNDIDPNRFEI